MYVPKDYKVDYSDGIVSVTGLGLMIGIEVEEGYTNKEIANRLIENGLLILTAGTKLRILPPLVITKENVDEACARLAKSIAEVKG